MYCSVGTITLIAIIIIIITSFKVGAQTWLIANKSQLTNITKCSFKERAK